MAIRWCVMLPVAELARLYASEFGDVERLSIDSIEAEGDTLYAKVSVTMKPTLGYVSMILDVRDEPGV